MASEKNSYQREWQKNNSEKIKGYQNKYYQSHRKNEIAGMREWREKNPDKVRKNHAKHYVIYKVTWRTWFLKNGYIPPSRQFNYHHVDPDSKKFAIGTFVLTYPCSIKQQFVIREELEKCVLLSAQEHMQLHRALNEGEPI